MQRYRGDRIGSPKYGGVGVGVGDTVGWGGVRGSDRESEIRWGGGQRYSGVGGRIGSQKYSGYGWGQSYGRGGGVWGTGGGGGAGVWGRIGSQKYGVVGVGSEIRQGRGCMEQGGGGQIYGDRRRPPPSLPSPPPTPLNNFEHVCYICRQISLIPTQQRSTHTPSKSTRFSNNTLASAMMTWTTFGKVIVGAEVAPPAEEAHRRVLPNPLPEGSLFTETRTSQSLIKGWKLDVEMPCPTPAATLSQNNPETTRPNLLALCRKRWTKTSCRWR